MIETQRQELLVHEPGVRLGTDTENLHEHRVAARRTRAFLRATRELRRPGLAAAARRPARRPRRADRARFATSTSCSSTSARSSTRSTSPTPRAAGSSSAVLETERREARRPLVELLDTGRAPVAARAARGSRPGSPKAWRRSRSTQLARDEFRRLARAVGRLGKRPDDDGHPPAPDRAQARPVRRRALRARAARPAGASSPTPARSRPCSASTRTPSSPRSACGRPPSSTGRRRPRSSPVASPSGSAPAANARSSACLLRGSGSGRAAAGSAGALASAPPGFSAAAGRSGCTASAPSSRPDTSPWPRRSTPSRR